MNTFTLNTKKLGKVIFSIEGRETKDFENYEVVSIYTTDYDYSTVSSLARTDLTRIVEDQLIDIANAILASANNADTLDWVLEKQAHLINILQCEEFKLVADQIRLQAD